MAQQQRVVLEVRPARDSEETPEAVVQFLAGLTSSLRTGWWQELTQTQATITLEIASLRQTVYFIITAPEQLEGLIRSQLVAQYKTALVTKMDDYLPAWGKYGQRFVQQLVLKAPSYLPIKTYKDFANTDPLVGVMGVLAKAPRDTAAVVQIVLSKATSGWSSAGKSMIKQGISSDPEKFEAHPQKALIESKIGMPAYAVAIRLFAASPTPESSQMLVGQMAGALGTFALAESNALGFPKRTRQFELMNAFRERSMKETPRGQYLNLSELASLFHLPNISLSPMKNLAWGKSIKGEPPDNLPVEEDLSEEEMKTTTFFAKTEYKNKMTEFGVKLGDRRRHFYILGKSGTGKSTLIANMALTDMKNGQGLGVIDPHGDLCDIMLDYIPDSRVNDVVYLDPSDVNNPFRLNPLEVKRPEHKELVASGIVAIFAKIFYYSWGPRLEYILRNTLMTLVEVPGSTLIDVVNILTNDSFRDQIVSQLPRDNVVLINFWEREYNEYPDKLKTEAIAPILNKVGQFVGSPTIRRIIGHPVSTVNLEEIMNSGKIVILNLSQGKLGEDNATLLGAMFITQFQQAAMNRVNIPEETRRDFFLYVDEFQNFATTSFIKILSEARKYRLGLVLANQYTAQLPEEIQAAIFGNVGSVASFVVGADDASRLMKEFGGIYTQDDLVSLDKFQIISKVAVDNRISGAFPAFTLPLPPDKTNNREKVVARSRELYTKNMAEALPSLLNRPMETEEDYLAKRFSPPDLRQGGGQRYSRPQGGGNNRPGSGSSTRWNQGQQPRGRDQRQGYQGGGRPNEYPRRDDRGFQGGGRYDRQPQHQQRPQSSVPTPAVKPPLAPTQTSAPKPEQTREFQPAPTFDGRPHTDVLAVTPPHEMISSPVVQKPIQAPVAPFQPPLRPLRESTGPTQIFSTVKAQQATPAPSGDNSDQSKKELSYKDIFG